MAAMLCDVFVVVLVKRTRPRSMPLAMLTRVARVSVSMHACVSDGYGAPLGGTPQLTKIYTKAAPQLIKDTFDYFRSGALWFSLFLNLEVNLRVIYHS